MQLRTANERQLPQQICNTKEYEHTKFKKAPQNNIEIKKTLEEGKPPPKKIRGPF